MSQTYTSACPAWWKARAMARPIPDAPAVTRTLVIRMALR